MVQVGSKSDEAGAGEPVGEALEEIRQPPPCVEDQNARSVAFLRDRQISRDLAFGALEFNHSRAFTSSRRRARESARALKPFAETAGRPCLEKTEKWSGWDVNRRLCN